MADLQHEIVAYDEMRSKLEAAHLGEWALVHDGQLIETFPSFEAAAAAAVRRFGRGPYLIRQIGAAALSLPTSLMYREDYEADASRI